MRSPVKKHRAPPLFLVGSLWHTRFTRNGKRTQRSTGAWANQHALAEQIAWGMYCGETLVATLLALGREWLDTHETVVSPAHLRNVNAFVRRGLYDLGGIRIDRITTEDVERARNRHLERYAAATTNQWLRTLRLLYGWALRRNMIDRIPWRVSPIKLQKKPKVILPAAKACAWLDAVDAAAGPRWGIATAVKMSLALGLRESESLSSRWEWIDWERSSYCPGITKGREAVPLPMPPWLALHLQSRKKPEGLIVVSPRGGAYAAGATRAVIIKANVAAGVVGLSVHKLRNTFATRLSEDGMPIQGIQQLLRHKDIKTTAGYLEVNLEGAAAAQARIAQRLGLAREGREIGGAEVSEVRP